MSQQLLDLFPKLMPWLAFGTLTRNLAEGETIVGGGADADWRVATADLMPRHFVVTVHGLNTSIRPSSGDVVVVVNGLQLDGLYHLLHEGDEIAAGRGRFIYTDDAPGSATVAREEPREAAEVGYLVSDASRIAYPLERRSSTLGRDVSNTILIRDPSASRFHAEVRREAGGFALHSMGAAGTLLNGTRMTGPTLLADGDQIEIALTRLRFTQGPLPKEIAVAHEAAVLDDPVSTRATVGRPRATMESPTDATRQPPSAAPLIVLLGLMVLGGIVVAVAGLVWAGMSR